jgi:hypothetical protein
VNTPINNFLKDKNCSFLMEERDSNKKTLQIVNILKSIRKEELIEMGKNGLSEIKLHYTKEVVTDQYINLTKSLLH